MGFFYEEDFMSISSPFDIVADLDTPVSAFLKLRDMQPCFLLESVESGERLARYSFLGFGETVKVRFDDEGLFVDETLHSCPSNQQEYLDALRQLLSDAPKLKPSIDELPLSDYSKPSRAKQRRKIIYPKLSLLCQLLYWFLII